MKTTAVINLILSAYDLDLLIKACELTAQKAPNKLAFNRLLKMSHDLMDQKHKHDED